MINSDFIIRYTDGLYSVSEDCLPRYDEIRDMFSSGQIKSKEWLVSELMNIGIEDASIAIAGAWFGTLGFMLKEHLKDVDVTLIDIDKRCAPFVESISRGDFSIRYVTEDMYKYPYYQDVIINTSCEHIPDIQKWISLLPKGTIVVLQSNNFYEGQGHINCVSSKEEFLEQAKLTGVYYSGELVMPMYTRYMIIGKI